jgi:hypothetical protein
MSSTGMVRSVPSSAHHVLVSKSPHNARLQPFWDALGHLMKDLITSLNRSGEKGSP